MARRKLKRRKADRSLVSAKQHYEVYYFARKHRMTPAAVRKLIKKVGHSRKKARCGRRQNEEEAAEGHQAQEAPLIFARASARSEVERRALCKSKRAAVVFAY
jgi:hypothetical protein